MTTKELIKLLKEMDPDGTRRVLVSNENADYIEIVGWHGRDLGKGHWSVLLSGETEK